ncbi:MAG: UbiA family prenyltransferase [Candidatus Dormibacteria bacterium]
MSPAHPGPMPEPALAPRTLPARGRAALALLHPGPSLLVTACFVAAAAATRHQLPSLLVGVRLAGVMLPQQLAIGALNDLCDRDLDRLSKPGKPLASGAIGPPVAWTATVAGFALALAAAATFPLPTLPFAAVCAASGIAYDLGLKRGALSWLPFWVGFACLPLTAGAAMGHLSLRVAVAAPPLALALALSIQLANALPDIDADRRSGARGLAVRLGPGWSRRLSLGLAALAGMAAAAAAPLLGQPVPVVVLGALPLVAISTGLMLRPLPRPFPLLAPAVAVLAAVWLLALP